MSQLRCFFCVCNALFYKDIATTVHEMKLRSSYIFVEIVFIVNVATSSKSFIVITDH